MRGACAHLDCKSALILFRASQQYVVAGEIPVQNIRLMEVAQSIHNLNSCGQDTVQVRVTRQNGQGLGLPEPALLNALLQSRKSLLLLC